MKKILTCLFAAASLLPVHAGEAEKWWDHALNFEQMPSDQIPPWSRSGLDGDAVIENGKLIIATHDDKQNLAFSLREDENWESLTVEFRVRVLESNSPNAAQFNIITNTATYFMPIKNTEEVLFRAVLDHGVMTLYRDGGDPVVIKSLPTARTRYPSELLFGDAGSRISGVTEWSALRWAWGRAVHP